LRRVVQEELDFLRYKPVERPGKIRHHVIYSPRGQPGRPGSNKVTPPGQAAAVPPFRQIEQNPEHHETSAVNEKDKEQPPPRGAACRGGIRPVAWKKVAVGEPHVGEELVDESQ